MKINCETTKGGAVALNEDHGVGCSYAVTEGSELLYTWITLPNGRSIQFFCNRESGLVCVDVVNAEGTGGNEVLRINANETAMPKGARRGRGQDVRTVTR